jgi:2-dehydro-3-deoxygluconokinase
MTDSPTVTFGELMLRLAPPAFERLLQSPHFEATFGGGEANVAAALAEFGLPARFVTVLAQNNPIADAACAEMRRFAVDVSHIRFGKGRHGIYYLETGANQRASKVVYDREGSAIAIAKTGTIDWDAVFAGAGWFHITGITPAISESAAELTMEAIAKARATGLTVSCDLNYRKNLWRWGKSPAEVMPDIVRSADVVIANEEDVQMSLGIASEADVHSGRIALEHYESLSNRVLAAYPNLASIAITLRESISASRNIWGACFHDRRQFLSSRRYDITHIIDRVGSGDSFAAGLIYGLRVLQTPVEALEFATAASCLKHSISGDFARISVSEVWQLLAGDGSGRVQR